MKKFLSICILLLTATGFAQSVQKVDDFSRVMIDVEAQVEIVHSTQSKVIMSLPEDQLKDITVTSKDGSLMIKQNSSKSHKNLRIRIYTSRLNGLAVMSDGNVDLRDFKSQDNLTIQSNGSATINTGDAKIKNLNIIRTGTSSVMHKNTENLKESVDGVMTMG
jgi:hypothetical protein